MTELAMFAGSNGGLWVTNGTAKGTFELTPVNGSYSGGLFGGSTGFSPAVAYRVFRRPCAPLRFLLRNTARLVTLFDVLGLSFLLVRVCRFVTPWHRALLFACRSAAEKSCITHALMCVSMQPRVIAGMRAISISRSLERSGLDPNPT